MVTSYLAYAYDGKVAVAHDPSQPVSSLLNSSNDHILVSATSDTLLLCHLRTATTATLSNSDTLHAGKVTAIAINPTIQVIAAGYADGSLRVWHLDDAHFTSNAPSSNTEPRATLRAASASVSVVKWGDRPHENPTAQYLASATVTGHLYIWDWMSNTIIHSIEVCPSPISGLAPIWLAAVPYMLVSAADGLLKLYAIDSGHAVQSTFESTRVRHLNSTHHGTHLLVYGPSSCTLYTVSQPPDAPHACFVRVGPVNLNDAPKLNPNTSDLLSLNSQSYFAALTTRSRFRLFRLLPDPVPVQDRRKRPRKQSAPTDPDSSGVQETAQREDAAPSRRRGELELGFTADDYLEEVALPKEFTIHAKSLRFHAYSHDAREEHELTPLHVVMTSSGAEITSLRLKPTPRRKKKLRAGAAAFKACTIERNGSMVGEWHAEAINCVSVGGEGDDYVMSTDSKCVKVWDMRTRKLSLSLSIPGRITCCKFIGFDGACGVVGTESGSLVFFDTNTGIIRLQADTAHKGAVRDLWTDTESSDGAVLASCGTDRAIHFWDVSGIHSGRVSESGHTELSDSVSLIRGQSAGKVICAALSDCTVRCIDVATQKLRLSLYGHSLPVLGMDMSTDGRLLATCAGDRSIKVWDLEFGECRRSFRTSASPVTCLAFQPKTHYFFTGAKDGMVQYWDGDKLDMITSLPRLPAPVEALDITADGSTLLSAGADRSIRCWRRGSEQIFLDEQKDLRLESALLNGGDHGNATTANGGNSYSETDMLIRAVEHILNKKAEMEEEHEEAFDPFMMGQTTPQYICRALFKIPVAHVIEELPKLPTEQITLILDCLVDYMNTPEMTNMYAEQCCVVATCIMKHFGPEILRSLDMRKRVRSLLANCKQQLSNVKESFGFCRAGMMEFGSSI
eukprot:GFKZ01002679.1.p2 GENE.GFKZ01002679.1~~GFKZ01002679.1.p2  ORF type:complete len:905 (+),score=107.90 GFKZ01002679.1:76-2790(+)